MQALACLCVNMLVRAPVCVCVRVSHPPGHSTDLTTCPPSQSLKVWVCLALRHLPTGPKWGTLQDACSWGMSEVGEKTQQGWDTEA